MANENGEWVARGLSDTDPNVIRTIDEAVKYIETVGFLSLFANEIPGFSLEEHTAKKCWWSGDPEKDPWMWREKIASEGKIVYGKFFEKKSGFLSAEWLPYFANYRRDGYDFDARWDDELTSIRHKKIMDVIEKEERLFSFELKEKAGFGKGGEKNFEGIITDLQMQLYLCMCDFGRKKNKKGVEYGWSVAQYAKPENVFGAETVKRAYAEEPAVSRERILQRMQELYPDADPKKIRKAIS